LSLGWIWHIINAMDDPSPKGAAATLAVVIPCYNEEKVLPEIGRRMMSLLRRLMSSGKIAANSKIYFVDDGSKDRTWTMIESLAADHACIAGIKLSRNRGHQNALFAGLSAADGDVLVSIDADLQDDIDAIEAMLDKYRAGNDIVYGVRRNREEDSAFKRLTAQAFYRLQWSAGNCPPPGG